MPTVSELKAEIKRLSAPIEDFSDPRLAPLVSAIGDAIRENPYGDAASVMEEFGLPETPQDFYIGIGLTVRSTTEGIQALVAGDDNGPLISGLRLALGERFVNGTIEDWYVN